MVGGVLLEHAWWGSVFLVNTPVMLVILALATTLPESRTPAPGGLDLLGLLLSLLTMVPFVLAVKTFAEDAPLALAELTLAVVAGTFFVARARARRQAGLEPLLDVELFAAPLFRMAALANATTMFAYTGLLFVLTQYLQLVVGLSPLRAGLLLVPGALVTMVAGVGAARLARYASFRTLVPAGLLFAAAGFGVLAVALDGPEMALGAAVLTTMLVGAGIGMSETLTNDAILASAPPARAGSASAVSETAYEVGAVLGTAVLGSVLAAAYAASLAVPTSIGPVYAQDARETIGGAVGLADRVGGEEGQILLDAATSAFQHATVVDGRRRGRGARRHGRPRGAWRAQPPAAALETAGTDEHRLRARGAGRPAASAEGEPEGCSRRGPTASSGPPRRSATPGDAPGYG